MSTVILFFSAGLTGCFDDIPICIIGWLCPCYLFGQNAEKVRGSSAISACLGYACLNFICGVGCLLHHPVRGELRNAHDIIEEPNDWIAAIPCCAGCAHCQEARELKYRGKVI